MTHRRTQKDTTMANTDPTTRPIVDVTSTIDEYLDGGTVLDNGEGVGVTLGKRGGGGLRIGKAMIESLVH